MENCKFITNFICICIITIATIYIDHDAQCNEDLNKTIQTYQPSSYKTSSWTEASAGSVVIESSAVIGLSSTIVQSGSGVKVGVIAPGVDGWQTSQNTGDLPAGFAFANASGFNSSITNYRVGGLNGMMKSMQKEHPEVFWRLLDVASSLSEHEIANQIYRELHDTNRNLVEVGWDGQSRVTLEPRTRMRAS